MNKGFGFLLIPVLVLANASCLTRKRPAGVLVVNAPLEIYQIYDENLVIPQPPLPRQEFEWLLYIREGSGEEIFVYVDQYQILRVSQAWEDVKFYSFYLWAEDPYQAFRVVDGRVSEECFPNSRLWLLEADEREIISGLHRTFLKIKAVNIEKTESGPTDKEEPVKDEIFKPGRARISVR